MKRIDFREEMMEQVNGGSYSVKISDPECSMYVPYVEIGKFTYKEEMLNTVKVLTEHGLYVFVDPTSIFDDDSVCGRYSRNSFAPLGEDCGL